MDSQLDHNDAETAEADTFLQSMEIAKANSIASFATEFAANEAVYRIQPSIDVPSESSQDDPPPSTQQRPQPRVNECPEVAADPEARERLEQVKKREEELRVRELFQKELELMRQSMAVEGAIGQQRGSTKRKEPEVTQEMDQGQESSSAAAVPSSRKRPLEDGDEDDEVTDMRRGHVKLFKELWRKQLIIQIMKQEDAEIQPENDSNEVDSEDESHSPPSTQPRVNECPGPEEWSLQWNDSLPRDSQLVNVAPEDSLPRDSQLVNGPPEDSLSPDSQLADQNGRIVTSKWQVPSSRSSSETGQLKRKR